jgi:hypothetical protein
MKKLLITVLTLALSVSAFATYRYQVRNYCEDEAIHKFGWLSADNPSWKHADCGAHTVRDYSIIRTAEHTGSVKGRYDPTGGLPGSPSAGDVYISTATANGWTATYLYIYNGAVWEEEIPHEGQEAWVDDENFAYAYDGSGWITATAVKSGTVAGGSFAGNPKIYTATFGTAFPDTNYAVAVTGGDDRSYTFQTKLAGSFVINTNANLAITGDVDWMATAHFDP